MSWKREEGIGSREWVLARLDVTSVRTSSEERGLKQVRPSEVRVGEGVSGWALGKWSAKRSRQMRWQLECQCFLG